jgi:hypothetical protein
MKTNLLAVLIMSVVLQTAPGQEPSRETMLAVKPVIAKGIDYDSPATLAEADRCKVVLRHDGKGWDLLDGNNTILRSFRDTNGDRVADLWIFYKAGRERYREVATGKNHRVDLGIGTESASQIRVIYREGILPYRLIDD